MRLAEKLDWKGLINFFVINFIVENLITVTETQYSKINNRAAGILHNVINYSRRLKVETFKTKHEKQT
jgi:hypothetical protein